MELPDKEILAKSYNDLVFERRNKAYGSYVLRRLIPVYTLRATLITASCVVVIIVLMVVDFSFFRKQNEVLVLPMEVNLSDPPQILQALPPAVPPAAEKMATTELVEMEVKKDLEVADEKPVNKEDQTDTLSTGTAENGNNIHSIENGNGSTIYRSVEENPEYPGGKIGLTRYLKDNLVYPKEAEDNGITGTVVVVFIINEDGSVSDVKVQQGIGGGCDQEAVRIVSAMRKWKPGKQGGVPVKVYGRLPITFKLQE